MFNLKVIFIHFTSAYFADFFLNPCCKMRHVHRNNTNKRSRKRKIIFQSVHFHAFVPQKYAVNFNELCEENYNFFYFIFGLFNFYFSRLKATADFSACLAVSVK